MNNILLILKDFTESGNDRFFIHSGGLLNEKSAFEVSEEKEPLICHDYWEIAPAIIKLAGKLPGCVIDICEFFTAISGFKKERKLRDKAELKSFFLDGHLDSPPDDADSQRETDLISSYLNIYYKRSEFNKEVYEQVAHLIGARWEHLNQRAKELREGDRQFEVEIPVFNILHKHIASGIRINLGHLRHYKESIQYDYYKLLMRFSEEYDLPLEPPSDHQVIEYLEERGFNFNEASVEYMLEFVPAPNGFSEAVIEIRKANASLKLLSALPLSKQFSVPIIDAFGSITSRIYFKDPVFQNISKQYRNVIESKDGMSLTYIDYDQFEVGIMAALSGDNCMKALYEDDDLYETLSEKVFGDKSQRKFSKRLFLSYAYGMKLKSISDAAHLHGAERSTVNQFFRQFSRFEEWKKAKQLEYEDSGEIATLQGNYLRRERNGSLTEKEKRSCISQVVQGTGSLIFKRALIAIDKIGGYRIILPMHDAVLVEHETGRDTSDLVSILCDAMTESLNGNIKGKASISNFFES